MLSADLGKYTIVVDDASGGEVKTLSKSLLDTFNYELGLSATLGYDENTEVSEYEILIGETDRPETEAFDELIDYGFCGYAAVGKKIVILGSDDEYTEMAIVLFASLVLLERDTAAEKFMTSEDVHIVDATNMLSVMSYNLKVANAYNSGTAVLTMIKNYMPYLLGVQEASDDWMSALDNGLSNYGYEYVGLGRDTNDSGERSAIFYRADKVELLDTKTFWLTDTPDKVSKVDGANCNRIVTVATFRRISDDKIFTYANTHLDHSTADIRIQQIDFLDTYVKDFANGDFIVTGDFNLGTMGSEYAHLLDIGYENCSKLAKYARGRDDNTFTGGSLIDFCFRNGDSFEPYFYTVCDELIGGKVPSDHHPIFLMLDLE